MVSKLKIYLILTMIALFPVTASSNSDAGLVVLTQRVLLTALDPDKAIWSNYVKTEWRLDLNENGDLVPWVRITVTAREIFIGDNNSERAGGILNQWIPFEHPYLWFEPDKNDPQTGKVFIRLYYENEKHEDIHCADRLKQYYIYDKHNGSRYPINSEGRIVESEESRFSITSQYVWASRNCILSSNIVDDSQGDGNSYVETRLIVH